MICNNILEAIGNTPVVRLNRLADESSAEVLVKFEGLNVGGSIKTRTAWNMIYQAKRKGLLNNKTVICEPTSGNQGIGIALVGAILGLKVVIVMPDSVSEERRKIVKSYGAEVILVPDNKDIGECIKKCKEKVMSIAKCNPNVFVPAQFSNPDNPLIHYNQTGKELVEQVGKEIHGFCSGFGTGGTISGVGKLLKEKYPSVKIWVAEPENAAILSKKKITSHMQMGIGDGIIPENFNVNIYDEISIVKDEEAIHMSKKLAKLEGLLTGISGGTNVVVALRLAKKLGKNKTVVTILPDTGERYFSTPLFERCEESCCASY